MYKINKLYEDEFGRMSGILAIRKEKGITSHDVVDLVRDILKTKKVGHAGTLDPFARGILNILVGKATKQSDNFLKLNKTYTATILFGITTDTLDTEGLVLDSHYTNNISDIQLDSAIQNFSPSYNQHVPIFSSVKVKGEKLRVLARKFERFSIVKRDGNSYAMFYKNNILAHETKIPSKQVSIYSYKIDFLNIMTQASLKSEYEMLYSQIESSIKSANENVSFQIAKISFECSAGTYIRQLAYDIGQSLQTPSMLVELERTKVGDVDLTNSIATKDIYKLLN